MLNNKRLTIMGDTVLDDVKIASYGAILNLDNMDLSFTSRQVDKEACKLNKEIVRADQAEFEDFAYALQDILLSSK